MEQRSLSTDVQFVKGVGPRVAPSLAKVGIRTVGDLLYYMPRRYEDRRNLPPIANIRPGDWVTVIGDLVKVESRPTRSGMVILKAVLRDPTGIVHLTWFNQPWIKRTLEGAEGKLLAYGQVKDGDYVYEIASPEWEMLGEEDDPEDFARIVPVYPLKEGLYQKTVRRAVRSALQIYLDLVRDPLPAHVLQSRGLRDLTWCLRQIHEPSSESERLEARKRMVFEEFLYLQLALALRRAETQQEIGISFPISQLLFDSPAAPKSRRQAGLTRAKAAFSGEATLNGQSAVGVVLEADTTPTHLFDEEQRQARNSTPLWEQVHAMLPFELTGAQRRVIQEIWADMERPHPMNRLVQGDVGSGKTAVAACAILAAIRCGYQAVLMAPTEILAEQHFASLNQIFKPLEIDVELLVGKQTAAQKRRACERTAAGIANVAVGTHALIQEGVSFKNLGLVIVDEQHRFGVLQRMALREKGLGNPDVLVMTATPIPRTLTMTLYGDLDLSVIDELPPGRHAIKTHWKLPHERASVYGVVRKLIQEGRQAYFVCPMVSESEKMMTQAAEELYERLRNGEFADLRVGLLHGQMKSKDKEAVMDTFRRHELDILVSTTVIEVGVDVANASIMVIEDANRFGLSQLHQLRGRVGRGSHQSFCVLIADGKSSDATTRMEVMVSTSDGFKISEKDLELRGPGELAGTKQSGNVDFKIADLVQDGKMLEIAREAAFELIEEDPGLARPEHQAMLEGVRKRRSEMAVITVS